MIHIIYQLFSHFPKIVGIIILNFVITMFPFILEYKTDFLQLHKETMSLISSDDILFKRIVLSRL